MNLTHPSPSQWLVSSLANERWFGDGQPKWDHLPTSLQAKTERIKRSRLLKKHGSVTLGTLLAGCAPRARCLAGCCPECGRALQRLFAEKGKVFARYLTALCKEPKKVRVRSEKYMAEFVAKVGSLEDGDTARDIASKFGLIYAGGRLAIRYKLVPWKQSELRAAIRACYCAARDSLPDEGVISRQGTARLEKFLTSLKNKSEISSFDKLPGYRIRRANSHRYLIRTEVFNDVFETRVQRDLVLESLIRAKRISTSTPKGKYTRVGPREQFTWPNGKRRRSYQITMPKTSEA